MGVTLFHSHATTCRGEEAVKLPHQRIVAEPSARANGARAAMSVCTFTAMLTAEAARCEAEATAAKYLEVPQL